jgi:phosphoglycerate-specific signal transduction histidine kinase
VGLKLNGTHHADDVNLPEGNIKSMKKDTETPIGASKEVGLEVNTEKLSIGCTLVARMQGKITI